MPQMKRKFFLRSLSYHSAGFYGAYRTGLSAVLVFYKYQHVSEAD
jgi:hypothetical protein